MTDELVVLMGDAVAGHLTRASGGSLRLEYDDSYRDNESATALSVSLPLEVRAHTDRAVTPWLWGLLPDNEAVLARWSRAFHVSAASPFSLLTSPVGQDCAGAVRFISPDRLDEALRREGDVEWLDEADVAARLRDLQADATAWLGTDFSGRFSLAGAQAKTALLLRDERWGLPSGAMATSHILKPAILGFDDHDLNEHLCLRAAQLSGLVCASSRVTSFEDQSAVVVTRYDRLEREDGSLIRIHQEDLCQALGRHPGQKYQAEGGPTSNDIVGLLRGAMPASASEPAVWRFFDAVTFNWLICGTDAHSKNYSLLLSGRQVRLAPLYDIASALPYPGMPHQKVRMAMTFGGSYKVMARDATMWPRVAAEFGLGRDDVVGRARALIEKVPDAFAEAARERPIQQLASRLPTTLVDAVVERVKRCADTVR